MTLSNNNSSRTTAVNNVNESFDNRFTYAYQAREAGNQMPDEYKKSGTALFNDLAVFRLDVTKGESNRLLNQNNGGNLWTPNVRLKNPTIENLINDFSKTKYNGKAPYRVSDFLYAKHVNTIPNNRLITLRRYPAPIFDNLQIHAKDKSQIIKPIATAVTWASEEIGNKLSELLKFDVNLVWDDLEADVHDINYPDQSLGQSVGGKLFGTFAKNLSLISGEARTKFEQASATYNPYNGGPYANRVYGPVNVVNKTKKRGRGLEFASSFSLKFHYEAKSIGGINEKAAMLDLLANLLALTYNFGAFWGGDLRFFPQDPTRYPFPGGMNAMYKWYQGDPQPMLKAFFSQGSKGGGNISNFFNQLVSNPGEALKSLATGKSAQLGLNLLSKGSMPNILAIPSLLTGDPVGEWHLMIGNPYNPILMIGNLICTKMSIEFNDKLNYDGFPTEMIATIDLEHGRPRDSGDIQSMFQKGQGRTYYYPTGGPNDPKTNSLGQDKSDIRSSSTYNSQVDLSWNNSTDGDRAASVNRNSKNIQDNQKLINDSIATAGKTISERSRNFAALMGFGSGTDKNRTETNDESTRRRV